MVKKGQNTAMLIVPFHQALCNIMYSRQLTTPTQRRPDTLRQPTGDQLHRDPSLTTGRKLSGRAADMALSAHGMLRGRHKAELMVTTDMWSRAKTQTMPFQTLKSQN